MYDKRKIFEFIEPYYDIHAMFFVSLECISLMFIDFACYI